MYKVIYRFADLKDNNHVYEVGDEYPREGKEVADERIEELASAKNAIGQPLIEMIMAEPIEEVEAEAEIEAEEKPKAKKNK